MKSPARSAALPHRPPASGRAMVVAVVLPLFATFWFGKGPGMGATDLSAAISNSLSLSSILILSALGLAITFGVMRVINMAHGDLLMLGAYTAFVVTEQFKKHCPDYLDYNLAVAIPVSFLVVAFVGYLMEVGLIRFLYGRPLDTLL